MNDHDASATVGFGVNLAATSRLNVLFDFFYSIGLARVNDAADLDDLNNVAFLFSAGLAYGLGR